jgi:anaerobic glycerol-3-phosphate dehydrogenase
MANKKFLIRSMVEEGSLSHDAIMGQYVIRIKMASGDVTNIWFQNEEDAEKEYQRFIEVFDTIEITDTK